MSSSANIIHSLDAQFINASALTSLEVDRHHPGPVVRLIAPCAHIALYYQLKWEAKHCIGYNLLRHGYAAWSKGSVKDPSVNNLY